MGDEDHAAAEEEEEEEEKPAGEPRVLITGFLGTGCME
jgi:hypothetical protein